MNINTKKENGILTIRVEGKIDTGTAPAFESAVKGEIGQCSKLVFDFEKLSYISSAGLRVLLGAQKFMGEGEMKVINVNDTVNDIFEITGFSYVLDITRA